MTARARVGGRRGATARPSGSGRDAILSAAASVIGDSGYAALAIADIAAKSGMSRASIYEHFGSKLGLGVAVLEALGTGARSADADSEAHIQFLELALELFAAALREPAVGSTVAGIVRGVIEAIPSATAGDIPNTLLGSVRLLAEERPVQVVTPDVQEPARRALTLSSSPRLNVTIRDVAREAGVSVKTVSRVLNESSGVSSDTRSRILAAMAELEFLPNAHAQSLGRSSSDIVGLIVDGLSTLPFAVEIIRGAQDAAHEQSKTLFLVDCESDPHMLESIVRRFRAWQVSSLVFVSPHHQRVRPAQLEGFGDVVLVNCTDTKRVFPSIVPDEEQGAYLATSRLIRAGHRAIGFINGDPGFPATGLRLRGYRKALADAGIGFIAEYVRTGDWWQESGYREMKHLMRMRSRPSAVFCGNDWMAMGAYMAAQEDRIEIPGDVSIVGFDDRDVIAAHMLPTLTTIALPYFEMGQLAVREVLRGALPGAEETVPCRLVERASVREVGEPVS